MYLNRTELTTHPAAKKFIRLKPDSAGILGYSAASGDLRPEAAALCS